MGKFYCIIRGLWGTKCNPPKVCGIYRLSWEISIPRKVLTTHTFLKYFWRDEGTTQPLFGYYWRLQCACTSTARRSHTLQPKKPWPPGGLMTPVFLTFYHQKRGLLMIEIDGIIVPMYLSIKGIIFSCKLFSCFRFSAFTTPWCSVSIDLISQTDIGLALAFFSSIGEGSNR